MELFHKKHRPIEYVEWFVSDEEIEDSWMRFLSHTVGTPGGELPFADSSWTFSKHHTDVHVYKLAHRALYESPELDSSDIKITVLNANVTLTGTVKKEHDIEQAEIIVRRIKEVWAVNNALKIDVDKGNFRSPGMLIS